jgi:hypothetical protein
MKSQYDVVVCLRTCNVIRHHRIFWERVTIIIIIIIIIIIRFHNMLGSSGIAAQLAAAQDGLSSMKLSSSSSSSLSTKSPVQWVFGAVSTGFKRPGRQNSRSAPPGSEVKNDGSIPSHPHTPAWRLINQAQE